MKKKDEIKVCLVGSSGGHLTHLYMLKPFWKDKNRFWVTFDKEDARSLLEGEKVYPCYFPTNRSIKALIKNTRIAWNVLHALKQLLEELGCKVEFVDYHVGVPVITENADSKNKFVRKIEKGLETFRYQAPFTHKLAFIRYKQSFAQKYMPLLEITDEMNYNPTLDCLVIGSDEVFNCIQ